MEPLRQSAAEAGEEIPPRQRPRAKARLKMLRSDMPNPHETELVKPVLLSRTFSGAGPTSIHEVGETSKAFYLVYG
jgi:hypothetical protein